MKILFAANRFPYPPFRGDKLKIFHLARRLAEKHELHLITFLQDKNDLEYLPELEKIFTEIHLVRHEPFRSSLHALSAFVKPEPFQVRFFHSLKMQDKIAELLQQDHFDVIHVQHLRMAQYWSRVENIPRVLDLPDAYSLYWKRRHEAYKTGFSKWFAALEQRKVSCYESILKTFDRVLVCSTEDKHWLEEKLDLENTRLLPNGVDLEEFGTAEHNYSLNRDILFTGNMDYAPNVDAVIHFTRNIFPYIKAVFPDCRFIIAGQRPVKKVKSLAGEDILVTGFVKDLKTIYSQAGIVVAPLRFGAGTQNKVLEAMAMGVPVVSGPVGFGGLNIESGEGVCLALNPEEFARHCIQLLGDAGLRDKVGKAGRQVIRSRFDWDVLAGRLEEHFRAVLRS